MIKITPRRRPPGYIKTVLATFMFALLLSVTSVQTFIISGTNAEINVLERQLSEHSAKIDAIFERLDEIDKCVKSQGFTEEIPIPEESSKDDFLTSEDESATSEYPEYSDVNIKGVTVEVRTVPESRSNFKSWMDYRTITNRSSRQWTLQQSAWTDADGFRRFGDDYYMVAVGTYYLKDGVGDVLEIEFSSGIVIKAVVGDIKSDRHTDETRRFTLTDGSVVEFIVDRHEISQLARRMGDMSYAGITGDVVSITNFGRYFEVEK